MIIALAAISQVACTGESKESFSADKFLKIGVDKVTEACDNLTQADRYPRYIDHDQTSWTLVGVDD
ncbi:MAG: hypothetical protein SNG49_07100 [Rikenellaceae bacterium]